MVVNLRRWSPKGLGDLLWGAFALKLDIFLWGGCEGIFVRYGGVGVWRERPEWGGAQVERRMTPFERRSDDAAGA